MGRWLKRVLVFAGVWRLAGPIVTPRFRSGQEHPWRAPARTVFIGDREFLVRQVGAADGPDVLLIHGLGGSSLAEWYRIGPLLEERYRLTIVDHRSHGLSPRVTDRFDVADAADDIAAVMATLGLGSAHVVGYSMGGAIAQELAHRHPGRVERLALIATFSHHPPGWRLARRAGVWLVRAWERVTGVGTPEVRAGYLLATGAVEPKHARWLWDETHRRDVEAGAAASFSLLRFDSRPWLGRLSQPSMVIIPSRDQLVPSRWQYQLAARIPNARVLELAGARHEAPWTHTDRITQGLVEFFEKDG